ncbi:MAG: 30S ribosomal protein S17 [Candidatus Marinimicrobia bacterium]|jgi:small subunit ribosomal protein S17|nr:30S ribosomal protein S17 [Candidatus Neomarinimicrobiota bacterium]
MTEKRKRQALTGEVVSTKMAKTVVVKVTRKIKHPLYKKYIKVYKKYFAHTGTVEPKQGDIVKISSVRPISKMKRWQVSEIIREAKIIG